MVSAGEKRGVRTLSDDEALALRVSGTAVRPEKVVWNNEVWLPKLLQVAILGTGGLVASDEAQASVFSRAVIIALALWCRAYRSLASGAECIVTARLMPVGLPVVESACRDVGLVKC